MGPLISTRWKKWCSSVCRLYDWLWLWPIVSAVIAQWSIVAHGNDFSVRRVWGFSMFPSHFHGFEQWKTISRKSVRCPSAYCTIYTKLSLAKHPGVLRIIPLHTWSAKGALHSLGFPWFQWSTMHVTRYGVFLRAALNSKLSEVQLQHLVHDLSPCEGCGLLGWEDQWPWPGKIWKTAKLQQYGQSHLESRKDMRRWDLSTYGQRKVEDRYTEADHYLDG